MRPLSHPAELKTQIHDPRRIPRNVLESFGMWGTQLFISM